VNMPDGISQNISLNSIRYLPFYLSMGNRFPEIEYAANAWWMKLTASVKRHKNLIAAYGNYIDHCIDLDIPVIFETIHLAEVLNIKYTAMWEICQDASQFYRKFKIPKRSGGFREIDMPFGELMQAQRTILCLILNKISIEDAAHGFCRGRSILTNAQCHLGETWLLKMDIKDFFPSISSNRVYRIFARLGYPPNVSYFLTNLCCINGHIPQGSPTSPVISNIIAKRLDRRLTKLASTYHANYSRYADDITFTGKYIPSRFISIVQEIIADEGFVTNTAKTRLIKGKRKKIVAGISVSGNMPRLPKDTKRKLRQEVHLVLKYGLYNQIDKMDSPNPMYLESLFGKLAFWQFVEPTNPFPRKAKEWLKNASI
jgi:RNA-directed DNA polymerase